MKQKNILYTWRQELGLTAKDAGELLGVDKTTIFRAEERDKADNLYKLAALAIIDGRKPEDLDEWAKGV